MINKFTVFPLAESAVIQSLGLPNDVDVGRSTEVQKKIKDAQLKMQVSNQKIRDLGINIRYFNTSKNAKNENKFRNSVGLDEVAHTDPSYLELHCLRSVL